MFQALPAPRARPPSSAEWRRRRRRAHSLSASGPFARRRRSASSANTAARRASGAAACRAASLARRRIRCGSFERAGRFGDLRPHRFPVGRGRGITTGSREETLDEDSSLECPPGLVTPGSSVSLSASPVQQDDHRSAVTMAPTSSTARISIPMERRIPRRRLTRAGRRGRRRRLAGECGRLLLPTERATRLITPASGSVVVVVGAAVVVGDRRRCRGRRRGPAGCRPLRWPVRGCRGGFRDGGRFRGPGAGRGGAEIRHTGRARDRL